MPAAERLFSSRELLAVVGITRKTLRVIQDHGLLQPARRSGARRYDQACLRRLWLVTVLRRLDFSLEEIARLLDAGETTGDAGEAARALTTSVNRVIRKIDGSIRDLELAREALAVTRATLEACGTCKHARSECEGCARNGKLDTVSAVLLTRAGREVTVDVAPLETADPAAATSVRGDGPDGPSDLVRGLRRSRA